MTDERQNRQDQQWLDALAGKPNPEADPLLNSQAAQVRKELTTRRNALDQVVPHADEALYEHIQDKALNRKNGVKHGWLRSWKAILGLVLTSFILGVTITRILMVPSLQGTRSSAPTEEIILFAHREMVPSLGATRSSASTEESRGRDLVRDQLLSTLPKIRPSARSQPELPVVTVRLENPLASVQVVSAEAIRLGLRVSVEPIKSGYRVTVDRLTAYAPAELPIREALGLNDSASGELIFDVLKKAN